MGLGDSSAGKVLGMQHEAPSSIPRTLLVIPALGEQRQVYSWGLLVN